MAVITLDDASPDPKYQQIVDQVKAHVVSGALPPGTPLPSVRQLATDLGINVNTVLAAYHALDAEGVVLLRHGARAVIHPRLAQRAEPAPHAVAQVRGALERVRADALLLGMTPDALLSLARQVFGE
ncbi:MAG TPA: GntR family transcriptional regulator [Ktedonobacterales bacterium]|nr:GntR family transcriptional regulator [Ktedonobacterales bacterium]